MKIIKLIFQFFKNIIKNYKYKKITKILQEKAQTKKTDRLQLTFLIAKFKRKYRKKSKSNTSEFIPWSFEDKQRIKGLLNHEFGDQMAQLNVKLNNDLQLV